MTDDKAPELLRATANKKLGQHFLFDPDILKRVALAGGPVDGADVIEIGPGPGGLTRALLDNGVRKLVCVEMDDRFAEALLSWPEASQGRLAVHKGDATAIDWPAFIDEHGLGQNIKIIANLPYNVGTPLFVGWLNQMSLFGTMSLMFQKEVAQRICAKPGSNHYGRLAVLSHAVIEPRMAFTLPPGAFKPPPKVASAVVSAKPLAEDKVYPHLDALQTVTAAAFGQRRKMLRASLKQIMPQGATTEQLLESVGIDPTRRAETLSQQEFRDLTTAWKAL
ncbi:16S rRNA (adenine(1518)-N(6)/adenine(1519)-N(6))-dimethyltransferase RsmA [Ponticaulis sp.]|uniref:16S rRNA (adenine(1518)-N(6)/adenine(1519)-N(6))- dimethyltransferase RsmA n=1 Tax=Ponticaulis sp. TaxID=2020902 RepID=UPI0025D2CFEE|nr:16S rRNA (adenine(1518)-N(6)/adenine(1519)-N(6))-dimethyltransferase RsmA [Ponticaulis sp.]